VSAFRGPVRVVAVWLAIDLGVLVLAVVLVVVFGVHAYARFRRMNRFGRRGVERVSALADQAGRLGERIDGLADEAEATDQRSQVMVQQLASEHGAAAVRRR
jgi:hypothetical protein